MAGDLRPITRPESARRPLSARNHQTCNSLVSHLRATRSGTPGLTSHAFTGDPASDIVRLSRLFERGECLPMHLSLGCLGHVRDFDIAAVGGESLLWMVAPVLRAARGQLMQANDERKVLDAEVSALRPRAEAAAFEAEGQDAWMRRAEEQIYDLVAARHMYHQELHQANIQMATKLADVESEAESLKLQMETGLSRQLDAWAWEQKGMEDEHASLSRCLVDLQAAVRSSEKNIQRTEDKLKDVREKLALIGPKVLQQEELRKKVVERELQIVEIEQQLRAVSAQKATKKGSRAGLARGFKL